ncbi:hypothetical protein G4D82_02040 [Flavobacterium sp. CYK-4]|uniref:hypothetical protein n=1 Tax=Flavobacterium lotistagni TaxID=2709660 RepID=UPI00140ACD4D|nr:hypothetical protein [Flavobacterium lotistagni]NHM05988.1 hypothetical protein [Flavobacterium lotistagni]
MKTNIILLAFISLLMSACVQKTQLQKVTYTLDVSKVKNIEKVGIRGADSPLSWESDLEMKPLVKDSLYQIEVRYLTGYKGTEVKFTVNGNFELQNRDNRPVRFAANSNSEFSAVFDQP